MCCSGELGLSYDGGLNKAVSLALFPDFTQSIGAADVRRGD